MTKYAEHISNGTRTGTQKFLTPGSLLLLPPHLTLSGSLTPVAPGLEALIIHLALRELGYNLQGVLMPLSYRRAEAGLRVRSSVECISHMFFSQGWVRKQEQHWAAWSLEATSKSPDTAIACFCLEPGPVPRNQCHC